MSIKFSFIQVKAFGDLTISASALRDLPELFLPRCSLLISPHLIDIAAVVNPGCAINVLSLTENHLPSVFDLKKRGFIKGIRSAYMLRDALRSSLYDSIPVMQKDGLREQFISGRRELKKLPVADNVYLAYKKFFVNNLYLNFDYRTKFDINECKKVKRLVLCPFSRVASKNMPVALVKKIIETCCQLGFKYEILLLEGECLNDLFADFQVRRIPCRFDALAAALNECIGVISVDSLPSHLAEYYKIPVFVTTPVVNSYWLPLSSYYGNHWGLYDRVPELTCRLEKFLMNL
jgi:hypothetical protein